MKTPFAFLALFMLSLSLAGCATVTINCEYYRIKNHVLEPVCVEEWPDRMPISRGPGDVR